ncbi:hypothetical protein [Teichococcus aestuarii]
MTSYPPDLAPSRRRLLGPRLGLPMMALGTAALLPGRISNLMEGPAGR